MLCALLVASPPFVEALRETVFDGYQRLFPRERRSAPVTIVAIDERTLMHVGQWPWPRSQVAELIERVAAHQPAAIGLDMLFPEPDRFSPDAIAGMLAHLPAELSVRLRELPSNDALLARAIKGRNVVLAIAGLEEPGPPRKSAAAAPPVRMAVPRELPLRDFAGRLSSIDVVAGAATGQGLISADTTQRVVRRLPLLARVDGTVTPALAVEMLRVATGAGTLDLRAKPGGLLELSFGDVRIPAQQDGSVWLRFGRHDPARFVSAMEIFQGRADPELFRSKLVLLGVTGLGLLDYQVTALGERVPGVEMHAQLIEQIFDRVSLVRPAWAKWLEAALLAAGALLLALLPTRRVARSAAALCALIAALLAIGLAAFLAGAMLIDPSWPAIGVLLTFAVLLAATLAKTERKRRVLRDDAAKAAGELAAARRIQMGLLPDLGAIATATTGLEVAGLLEPARSVGGDFYDCLKLDSGRIFFVVGDVSGKGMPAALFMALSKAILKAAAARSGSDVGRVLMRAGAEIARDNPEQLFVTAFAGILDPRTGMLEYSNAGHEPPYLLGASGMPERFPHGGGPPLCTLADFEYPTEYRQLNPGDRLCLVSDGVTEAMNAVQGLYGAPQLEQVLKSVPRSAPSQLIAAVQQDVSRFVGDAIASDDLTLMVLSWSGFGAARGDESADADLDAPVAGLFHPVSGRN